jgi:asparagine synthase (glutamine-hydrolysing)
MRATVAVVEKKNDKAVAIVVKMLEEMKQAEDQSYGIGTAIETEIAQTLDRIDGEKIKSATAIGHIFTKILPSDKPQPTKKKYSTVVFDGRIYSLQKQESDAAIFAKQMQGNFEKAAVSFIRHCEGDFVFTAAKNDRVIAGRDSLGIRPFYYGENEKIVAVSSERKALLKVGIKKTHSFPPGQVAVLSRTGFRFLPGRSLLGVKIRRVDMESAVHKLRGLLRLSVRERTLGLERMAVAFSGGLDSSIIAFLAKNEDVDVHLIHVSLENQDETEHAKVVAEQLDLPIHVYCYKDNDADQALMEIPDIIEKSEPLDVSVGIPVYWTAKRAAELDLSVMLAGQGADELFGGYKRYQECYIQHGKNRAEQEIKGDILAMHEVNFERDSKICNSQKVELRLPFATYQIARFALRLPLELKLDRRRDSLRKLVLRKTAENIGLPRLAVQRPKKAIQYATGINKSLIKRAKKEKLSLSEYLSKLSTTGLRDNS